VVFGSERFNPSEVGLLSPERNIKELMIAESAGKEESAKTCNAPIEYLSIECPFSYIFHTMLRSRLQMGFFMFSKSQIAKPPT